MAKDKAQPPRDSVSDLEIATAIKELSGGDGGRNELIAALNLSNEGKKHLTKRLQLMKQSGVKIPGQFFRKRGPRIAPTKEEAAELNKLLGG
jgi:hypothetical protein